MQLISQSNKGFRLLLCVIDVLNKYIWLISLKDKKYVSIFNAFQKVLDKSGQKPNKIWVGKGSEFCNSFFKKWLKDNVFEMYWIHNEGKSFVAERLIKTLKTKIYKYITSISKNLYIDKLDDIVNEYNNTYHRTIKIKSFEVNDNTYSDSTQLHLMELHSSKVVNNKDPKFEVGDHIRISKYLSF